MNTLALLDLAIEMMVIAKNDFEELQLIAERKKNYGLVNDAILARGRAADNLHQLRMERLCIVNLSYNKKESTDVQAQTTA